MIEWDTMMRLARERFDTGYVTAPMLLTVWAAHDADGDLKRILEPYGLTVAGLTGAMQPLLALAREEDGGGLVNECIRRGSGTPLSGADLLDRICAHPEHGVSRALVKAGLDMEGLRKSLPKRNRTSELARLGVALDAEAAPLVKYGRDLTAEAREGAFDDYCDRPKEIERLATVLMRMEQGNPALTGESGVGKTALVELLSREIVAGRVPGIARSTRVFEVRIGSLIAGTRYRGDFEERLEAVIQAVLHCSPSILFLDEAHLMSGAGRAEGAAIDMGQMLKSRLGRVGIRVIAATTAEEYNRHIAQDEALRRRFAEVRLSEPSSHLTEHMARKRAKALARHHQVEIADETIARAIELTDQHIPQQVQPSKTIGLLDAAAVIARRAGKAALDEASLLQTLSDLVGRDVEALQGAGRKVLRDLEGFLKARIVGQEAAIEKVVAAVIRQRQKLGALERNIGTFLFVGPTGVGKTELGRQLAGGLYRGGHDLLHLDMAEYSEPGCPNKLIGAPAGYVGHEREGVLIRWLQNCPTGGVLLFDEIEKAHKEVHNLLLGLLDNGRIHSARGTVMDCRHCVVILTSNAITDDDLSRGPLGFGGARTVANPADLLTDAFPREFLGRLDDIVLFQSLSDDDVERIVRLRLDEAVARLSKRGVALRADLPRLSRHLAKRLESDKTGARGVERLIEQTLLDPIGRVLVRSDTDENVEAAVGDAFYETGEIDVRDGLTGPYDSPGSS